MKAIVVAHTPELTAFTEGSVRVRPVVNGGAFVGDGFPVASPPPPAAGQAPPPRLGPPEGRDWVYWTENVSLD